MIKGKIQKFINAHALLLALLVASLTPLLWFGKGEIIAGGDNTHSYLNLGRKFTTLTTWDQTSNLGSPSPHLHNLWFTNLINLVSFLPDAFVQRVLFCFLIFARLFAFYLILKKLFPQESQPILFLPPLLLFSFNPFYLTDPISLISFLVPIQTSLIFLLAYKLISEQKLALIYLLLISLTNSLLFSNPPAMLVTYLPGGLLLILSGLRSPRRLTFLLSRLFLAAWLFLALNLWYLGPSLKRWQETASSLGVTNSFEATKSGKLIDHLRLIGQWGWYSKHYLSPYVPFAKNYDQIPLLLSTYGLLIFCLLSFTLWRKRKIFLFFFGLYLLGLMLANGSKPPLGRIYQMIFSSHPFFLMFREPWTKFTPLQVFSLPLLLYGSLLVIKTKISHRLNSTFISLFVSLIVLGNAYPLFTGEAVWSKWNGSMRSFQAAIPPYWKELKQYLESNNLQDERTLSLPPARYGMAYNWPHGLSTPNDVARYLLPNPILDFSSFPLQRSELAINQFYNVLSYPHFQLTNYLTLLNTEYLLQENDVDWRYSSHNPTPSQLTGFLVNQNLSLIKTFGEFDKNYLSQIPNDDPNEELRKSLSRELQGKPALALYRLKEQDKLPLFYASEKIIYTPNGIETLPDIVSFKDFSPSTAVYLRESDDSSQEPSYLKAGNYLTQAEKEMPLVLETLETSPILPQARISPSSPLYPLVRWKEERNLKKIDNDFDKADLLLWQATKRLVEGKKYGDSKASDRYLGQIEQEVKLLTNPKNNEEKLAEKVEKTLSYMAVNESLNPDPKIIEVHTKFKDWVKTRQSECQQNCYRLKIPEAGAYEILVDKDELGDVTENKNSTLRINQQNLSPRATTDRWLSYGQVSLPQGESYLNFDLPPLPSATDKDRWQNVRIVKGSTGEVSLKDKKEKLAYPEPLVYQELQDWPKADFFHISFEYQAKHGKLGLVILEDMQEVFKVELESKNIQNQWLNFEKYIKTRGGSSGAICFYYFSDNSAASTLGDGNFRNLSVTPLTQPTVFLRRQAEEKTPSVVTPKITFTKKNPTKYEVRVDGATEPFLLVFLENFHPDWQIRLKQTREMIAKDRHNVINGYANSWYILPKDAKNQSSYDLIVEFGWQRLFNWGATISALVFGACLIYIISQRKKFSQRNKS